MRSRAGIVTLALCLLACSNSRPPTESESLVAVQRDDGTWSSAAEQLILTAPADRYGLAIVCATEVTNSVDPRVSGKSAFVMIVQATRTELPSVPHPCPPGATPPGTPGPFHRVSWTASGLAAGETTLLAIGRASRYRLGDEIRVVSGTYDLFAMRGLNGSEFAPLSFVLRRDVVANGPISFHSGFASDGVRFVSHVATLDPEEPDRAASLAVKFRSHRLTTATLAEGTSPTTYPALPQASSSGNDIYLLSAESSDRRRQSLRLVRMARDVVLKLPASLSSVTVTTSSASPLTYRLDWGAYENLTGLVITFATGWNSYYAGDFRTWRIFVTAGWLAGASTYAIPKLTEAPGWRGWWGLQQGTASWSIRAISSNRTFGELLEALPELFDPADPSRPPQQSWDGYEVNTSSQTGQIAP